MAVLNTFILLLGLAGVAVALHHSWKMTRLAAPQLARWRLTLLVTALLFAGYTAVLMVLWLYPIASFSPVISLLLLLAGMGTALLAQISRQSTIVMSSMATALDEQTSHITYRDNHDRLTGLANRRHMARYLDRCLDADAGEQLALFSVNINGFKNINDTFGYDNGNAVLRVLASRIKGLVEDTDLAARNAADEFLIAVCPCTEQHTNEFAEALARTLKHRVELDENIDVPISAAIGIARFPEHGKSRESLIRRCDIALQSAKLQGLAYQMYQNGEEEAHLSRINLMAELRQAVTRNQLVLHYQPKQCLRNGQIVGVEALLRWYHPQHGLVPPDEFIALAEQSGIIESISTWVIDEALAQWQRWAAQHLVLDLSINISVRDLQGIGFSGMLIQKLYHHQVPAEHLILEITESAFMADRHQAVAGLAHLQKAGVRVAIDDFGTGYSSLSQLKDLPVNELKIDKSFIMALSETPDNGRIVRSIIELGRNLGLSVTAEGVEDEATRQLLKADGCDVIQGFGLSKPLPADHLLVWVNHHPVDSPVLTTRQADHTAPGDVAQYQPYPTSKRS